MASSRWTSAERPDFQGVHTAQVVVDYSKYYLGTKIDGPDLEGEQLCVGARNLNDLLGKATYTDALFHILLGRMPNETERKLFDLVLVAFHGGFGLLPPTTLVPRLVAGTGVGVPQALAAGYLASGTYHVGAVEQAMALYSEVRDAFHQQTSKNATAGDLEAFAYDAARQMIEQKETIPGYGHPLLRRDPRPPRVRRVLCDLGVESEFFDIYDGIVRCVKEIKGVVPNVDGITGAILLHLGFRSQHGTGLFLLARTAAMLAHVLEEMTVVPYQTQRRFMFLPVAAPKLFNADFTRLTKFFNRLRDNRLVKSIRRIFRGSTRAQSARDLVDDQQVAGEHRNKRNGQSLAPERKDPPPQSIREQFECDVEDVFAASDYCVSALADHFAQTGDEDDSKSQAAAELMREALQKIQEAEELCAGSAPEPA